MFELAPLLTLFLALIVLARSIFRSVDIKFQDNVQRLSRLNEIFREEVTFAHRQHIEDHVKEQRISNSTADQTAVQDGKKPVQQIEHDAQDGSYPSSASNC